MPNNTQGWDQQSWDQWSNAMGNTWTPDFSFSQPNQNVTPGQIDRTGSPGNPVFDMPFIPPPPQGGGPPPPQGGGAPPPQGGGAPPPQMGGGAPPPPQGGPPIPTGPDGALPLGSQPWADAYRAYIESLSTGGDGGGAGVGPALGPVGGWVNPSQTYTPHTGFEEDWDGDGNMTPTPTGGGNLIPPAFLQDEEKLFARPDLQGIGKEAFQDSQFASNPPRPPPVDRSAGADANAKAESLRQYAADQGRSKQVQRNFNNSGGAVTGPPNARPPNPPLYPQGGNS